MHIPTSITNSIRSFIDERLPRAIRDSPIFMYPFFLVWFKGKNTRLCMDFKRIAPSLSAPELRDVYARVVSLADGRITDTNAEALMHVVAAIDSGTESLLDVGCGSGHFLRSLQQDRRFDSLQLVGCDFARSPALGRAANVIGTIEELPFANRAFDVVTCFHTLEHTRDLARAIAELKRVCRKQLIVVVPRQKYFFYTLDLHLQFFATADALEAAMRMGGSAREFGSDLVYIAAV